MKPWWEENWAIGANNTVGRIVTTSEGGKKFVPFTGVVGNDPELATFIAAAPDLYRALARVIETIPTCTGLYTTVAAAMAKARGAR